MFYVISGVKTRMNGCQSLVHSKNFLRMRTVQSGVIRLVNQRALQSLNILRSGRVIKCGFIHSTFINTHYVPDTVLDTRDTFCLGLVRKTCK